MEKFTNATAGQSSQQNIYWTLTSWSIIPKSRRAQCALKNSLLNIVWNFIGKMHTWRHTDQWKWFSAQTIRDVSTLIKLGALFIFFLSLARILNNKGPFICDKCGKKLSTRRLFNNHIYQAHRKVVFQCDLCPRSFHRKCVFMEHFTRDHLKQRNFRCNICTHSTHKKIDLERHMAQHRSKEKCETCLQFVANLDRHRKVHVQVTCPICKKLFSQNCLPEHVRKHKNNINRCKDCNENFINKHELKL